MYMYMYMYIHICLSVLVCLTPSAPPYTYMYMHRYVHVRTYMYLASEQYCKYRATVIFKSLVVVHMYMYMYVCTLHLNNTVSMLYSIPGCGSPDSVGLGGSAGRGECQSSPVESSVHCCWPAV